MTTVGRLKSAVRSRLSRTKAGRAMVSGYAGRVERDQVHRESKRMQAVLAEHPGTLLRLVCDSGLSSPLYGETVQVLMLARYLSLIGHRVELVLIDPPLVASEWRANTQWSPDGFLADQVELARMLLPSGVVVTSGVPVAEARRASPAAGVHTIFEDVASEGGAVYHLTAYLLHSLVTEAGGALPDGFLLTADAIPLADGVEPWPSPYIAWHVRRGAWASDRDPSSRAIESDFAYLCRRFPGADIMIFSDSAGTAHTLDVLDDAGLLAEFARDGRRVTGQPEAGFASAIPRVLRAAFYFQRMGGGIAVIPGYSGTPYLMISANSGVHFAHAHSGERLVAWARPDQRFVVRTDAASVRIEELEAAR